MKYAIFTTLILSLNSTVYALQKEYTLNGVPVDAGSVILEMGDKVTVKAEAVTPDGKSALIDVNSNMKFSGYHLSPVTYSSVVNKHDAQNGEKYFSFSTKNNNKLGNEPGSDIDEVHSEFFKVKKIPFVADATPSKITSMEFSHQGKVFDPLIFVAKVGDVIRVKVTGETFDGKPASLLEMDGEIKHISPYARDYKVTKLDSQIGSIVFLYTVYDKDKIGMGPNGDHDASKTVVVKVIKSDFVADKNGAQLQKISVKIVRETKKNTDLSKINNSEIQEKSMQNDHQPSQTDAKQE